MVAALVLFVFLGTFLAAALVVFLVVAVQSGRQPQEEALESALLLAQEPSSTMPVWNRVLDRLNFTQKLRWSLNQAGLRWSVGRLTLAMLFVGSVGSALFVDVSWAPPWVPIAAFALGAYLPYRYIQRMRQKRLAAIDRQFPDALDSMARALRAGHAFPGAVSLLATEVSAPLGPEFRKIADEHRLGLSWETILSNFAERLPTAGVRLFVAAILIQTRTGGRVTEVLERLAETIRESAALRGEVRAIASHGRMTGVVLTALPLAIGGAMLFTNPGYIGLLIKDPTGNLLIWCSAGCLFIGHWTIQRIVDVRAPH